MNKIKKVLLFAMSFVMATGLFTGCMMLPQTNSSSSESTISGSSESSTESSTESSVESSTESSKESSVESSTESSVESSTESSTESSVDSSVEATKYVFTVVVDRLAPDGTTSTEVAAGEELVLPEDPETEGKTFAGWVDLEGNPVEEGAVMPEEDFAIYATWTITPYTLTIKEDGKEDVTLTFGIEAVPADEEAGTPEIISLAVLDYVLDGMLPEATEDTEYVFDGRPEEWALEDLTITLTEQVRRYTLVIRDGNPMMGGYYEESKLPIGAAIELPAREDVEGKTFLGWFYTDLETGEEFEAPETMPKFDIAIYAKWALVTKTLTINKLDGETYTYAIAVEEGGDYFNPIIGLDNIGWFLEGQLTPAASEFYTVSYEGIPETWELQDYTISEKAESSIAYFDRLNKTWEQKKNNANNYWDGCEGVTTVEHLAGAITKVGFDATKFTDEEVAAGNTAWSGWGDNRQMWVTFGVPVNGKNLHKFTITVEVKFENMTPSFNAFAAKIYTGNEGYDFEMGAEKGCSATSAEDLGDGWYRFSFEIVRSDNNVTDSIVGEAADYLLFSFDNTAADVDKSLPSYAYIRNLALNCIHEYSADCDTTCELCGEERYDAAAHAELSEEYESDGFGFSHYQICLTCGAEVIGFCETRYIVSESGHYEVCDVCGYESDMSAHDLGEGYTNEGHYSQGCYCGYIADTVVPHNPVTKYDESYHWEACTECWWEGEYVPHSGDLEMVEGGHKVLGCSVCGFEGSDEVVAHTYGDWTVSEEHDWISECECECGAKLVVKNRLDAPAQYFLTEEPTLDITGIFSEGADPETAWVTAAYSTYTYWDYEAAANVENYTHDFYTYTAVVVDGDKVTCTLDPEMVAAAPYFFGNKVITLTIEIGGASIDIPVTVTAVTKEINTAEELKALGAGGNTQPTEDIIGYYTLGNDITFTHQDDWSDLVAAGYPRSGEKFFLGTFDGRGYTLDNMRVSDGGIFGILRGTVKNVNITNVHLEENPPSGVSNQNGAYIAIIAYSAPGATIENINITMASSPNKWSWKRDGLLVCSGSSGATTFRKITVDASGLKLDTLLGISHNEGNVYEEVVIKAGAYVAIGYTGDSYKAGGVENIDVKMTEFPTGVTFEPVIRALNKEGALLPTYTGDATEMGFGADDQVQVVTMNGAWSDRIVLGDSKTANYLVFDFALSAPGNMTVWVTANGEMVGGYSYVVLANSGGLYVNEGSTPREFTVVDQGGNIVNSALSANTKYTMYVYLGVGTSTADATKTCDIDGIQLGADNTEFYVANLRYSDSSITYLTDKGGKVLPYYEGDVTALGFAEGTQVQYVEQDNRTRAWESSTGAGDNVGDLGKTMEQQCIKITKTAEEDYASIQFSLSRDLTGDNAFFAWCYDALSGGNCTTVTVSKNGTGSGGDITVKVFDLEGNEVTNIEAGKAYEMRFYSEINIRFQIGCYEANGEYITTYFANPSSGNDA